MKKNNNLVPTWLPVFNGFYENWHWEENLENEADYFKEEYGYKSNNLWTFFKYREWNLEISKRLCDVLKDELSEFVYTIIFQELRSPREYNFHTDAINCLIAPKTEVIKNYLYKNKEAFDKYLHDAYTSRSGFISWYDNNFEDWEINTTSFTDLTDKHYLGAILNFIAQNEGIDEDSIYDSVRDDLWENNFWKDELYDEFLNPIKEFARSVYMKPNRLELMYENFDATKYNVEDVLYKIENEIAEYTLKIPFPDEN